MTTMLTRSTVLALLLLTLPAVAPAASDPAAIRARGTLIVSVKNLGDADVSRHRDPAHFHKRALEVGIARAIAARLLGSPDKLELRMLRKPERLPALRAGEVDLAISMLRVTPESQALVDFSTPYYQGGLAVLQTRGGPVHGLADLRGRRFAVLDRNEGDTDRTTQRLGAALGAPLEAEPVENFRAGIAAIEAGRVVGLVSESANIDVFLARHGDGFERSPPLTTEHYAVAVAKGNTALLTLVNEVLVEMRDSGELARLEQAAELPAGGVTGAAP